MSMSTTEVELGLAQPEHGPRTLAPFGRRSAQVVANEPLGPYALISVEDSAGPAPVPGQFYMVSTARRWGDASGRPHLGRAFSVCRVHGRRLDFLLEAIGPGTQRLADLQTGEDVWLVGPLGIGFPDHPQGRRAVLVGGGIGVAPLVILEEALSGRGVETQALLGFRDESHVAARELFEQTCDIATDDGSHAGGHHGFVTELLERELRASDVVYACGPPAMLESVRRICAQRSIDAQLAMEAGMACGFGACFGCVVRTRSGYRRLCVDGPVVAAADLEEGWE